MKGICMKSGMGKALAYWEGGFAIVSMPSLRDDRLCHVHACAQNLHELLTAKSERKYCSFKSRIFTVFKYALSVSMNNLVLMQDHKRTETNLCYPTNMKPLSVTKIEESQIVLQNHIKIFGKFCIPVGLISWQRYQFQSGKSPLIFFNIILHLFQFVLQRFVCWCDAADQGVDGKLTCHLSDCVLRL